jgi:hypothetical protein
LFREFWKKNSTSRKNISGWVEIVLIMKDSYINVFDLFNRFKRYLENTHSNLEIQISKYDNMFKNERIYVKLPPSVISSVWYFDVDIETNLQLFFLGTAINNRDALIDSGIILPIFTSIFETLSNNYAVTNNPSIKNIVQLIGVPQSLEEISIKFDLLGI